MTQNYFVQKISFKSVLKTKTILKLFTFNQQKKNEKNGFFYLITTAELMIAVCCEKLYSCKGFGVVI